MRDGNFAGLATETLALERAVVTAGAEAGVLTPRYEVVGEVRAAVQPRTAGSAEGLLGRLAEGTDVVYVGGMEPEIEVGDALVRAAGERYEVLGVEDAAGRGHHRRLVVRRA